MTRIAHLSSVHPPFDARIFHKECKTLAQAGYEVVLVVPHDRDETVDGVRLRAVPRPRSRQDRLLRTWRAVYEAAIAEDAAIYHFHDPELLPVGLMLKRRGKAVIYDVHEDVPRQLLAKHYLPGAVRRPLSMIAERVEGLAAGLDAVVGATPTITRRFGKTRAITVHNFPFLAELLAPESTPYAAREAAVAYIGAIHPTRGARELVEAIGKLPEARLLLAGIMRPDTLEAELAALPGWARTEYLGQVDRQGVRDLLSRARVGLVTLHPTLSYLESYPIKLFEYMAAGLPFVASDFPLWRALMGDAEAGLFVDPGKPEAIAGAIAHLLAHPDEAAAMGRRGQEAVKTRFSWETEAEKLLGLYEELSG